VLGSIDHRKPVSHGNRLSILKIQRPISDRSKKRPEPSVLSAMQKWIVCWMLALLAGPALAQVESGASHPDSKSAIVAEWKGTASVLMPVEPLSLGNFSIAAEYADPGTADERKWISHESKSASWSLRSGAAGELIFSMSLHGGSAVIMQTPPQTNPARKVVVNIKRDSRQALSGLWIDGVEMASVAIPPGSMPFDAAVVKLNKNIRSLSIYDRALTRPEIIGLSSRPTAVIPSPFDGEFSVTEGEVIAVLGGTEAVGLIESAWLETALVSFAAGRKVSVRDLAWETDTAMRQDRPMNFGDLNQQLRRVGATTVILMFGRQECLELGAGGAGPFHDALEKIIHACSSQTQRLVIVGPAPFEKKEAPLPDLSAKNEALREYNEALLALAEKNRALFVDVMAAWRSDAPGLTTDGLNLSNTGQRLLAQIIARQLWNGLPVDSSAMPMRSAIIEKNKLWHDYWRPSNWAFLHGDRTAQPSSRDHLNPSVRWFPAELEKYRELISEKENEIRKLAAEQGGKLP